MDLLVALPQQLQQLMPPLEGQPVDMLLTLYIALGVLAVRLISEKLLLPPLTAAFKARLQGSDSEPYKIRKRVSFTATFIHLQLLCTVFGVVSIHAFCCEGSLVAVVQSSRQGCTLCGAGAHQPDICMHASMLSASLTWCQCSFLHIILLQHEHRLRLLLCHAAVALACLQLQLHYSPNQWPELCSASCRTPGSVAC
jgi:hypothetical protein